ncbi:MAG: ATP-binding protein [Herpetosiphon sp.]
MTDLPGHVQLSIASPGDIEATAQQLMTLRENYISGRTLAHLYPRSMIFDSWQRCQALDVDPGRRFAPFGVAGDAQLDLLREENAALVCAALPVMQHLKEFLSRSGYVIVLSDAHGCLLDVVGDADIRRRLALIDFVPGGIWSEAAAGTNAIGTALATGHGVQLMAAEHFCDGWQDLTCTAAPIRHPVTNAVIGVLDVTGDYRLIRSFLTSFLTAAALEINQRLHRQLSPTYPHARWDNDRQDENRLFPGTMSYLPHSSRATASGLVKRESHSFQERDAGFVVPTFTSRLAAQERRAQHAERLAAAIAGISASLDVETTVSKVAEQTAYLLELECAAVYLFDSDGRSESLFLWCRKAHIKTHVRAVLMRVLEETDAISVVRDYGEPLMVDDVTDSAVVSRLLLRQVGFRALAFLPLTSARGIIGCIVVPRHTTYHWSVDEVRLGLTLGCHAATAIDNARLFETLRQHNRHIGVLNAVAKFLGALHDPSQHLDLVLGHIASTMNLDIGVALLHDQPTGDLLVAGCTEPLATLEQQWGSYGMLLLKGLARQVVASGEPALVDGISTPYDWIQTVGLCELTVVPLDTSTPILGVLVVGSRRTRMLTASDLPIIASIGQQVGLALKNEQLMRSAGEMEALREADRLKNEFLTTVSHDLRSPLTAIRTSVESLLDEDGSPTVTSQSQLLQTIAGQSGRLVHLVDQLLDLSCIKAGAFQLDRDWIELRSLINDTLARFEDLHCEFHVLRQFPVELPVVYVDPDRLVQVLWNLLENASKYSPVHSLIVVDAQFTNTEIQIGVSDRGSGIPPADRENIFQHFYRLNKNQRGHAPGSGLGLAICRGIVEAHGGRIWVEDRTGGGSNFRVALPLPINEPHDAEILFGGGLPECTDRKGERDDNVA